MSGLRLFIPVTKIDEARRLVYGTLTAEVADKSGEIIDYATAKPAFEKWSNEISEATGGKSKGNVRAMHGSIAAGKFTDIHYDDDAKVIQGCAKIVDDAEWNKVLEGVYTGFSIGGGYARRWVDPNNSKLMRYTPTLSEVSIVDNPCVATATFQYIKADGSVEMRKFTPSHKEESMDPKELVDAKEALAKGTATDEQKALIAKAEADVLLKAAQDAEGKGEATDEQKALLAKAVAEAKPELVKDGKPVKPKTPPVQKNVWLASDDTEHPSKREAEVYNLHLEKQAELAPALSKMDELLKGAEKAADEKAAPSTPADGNATAKDAKANDLANAENPADEAGDDKTQAVKNTPTDVAEKAADAPVKKSLYGIGQLAGILSDITCFMQSAAYEAMYEGDASTIPAQVKAWLKQGAELLKAYVAEETAELVDGDDTLAMAAKMNSAHAAALAKFVKADKLKAELEKAGARHSSTDKEKLMDIHKSACAHADMIEKCFKGMGVMADEGDDKDAKKMSKLYEQLNSKTDEVLAVTKVAAASNETLLKAIPLIESLQKQVGNLQQEKSELVTRMDHLEKQPAAAKGHVRAVSKTQDSGGSGDGAAAKAESEARMAKLSPAEKSRELMKLAMSNPMELESL